MSTASSAAIAFWRK